MTYEQLSFAPNGNITPCPYKAECTTYGVGCQGTSYWCKRYDKQEKVYMLDVKGFMDDPYCPECDYNFTTYGQKNETDCERCPVCHVRVDWTRWHKIND